MAFGLLSSTIPSPGPVINLYTGPSNKLTIGKITIGSKNYDPSRIQIGYKDSGGEVRYFEYNRYIKYGEVIETENLFIGAGQELLVRSTEPDVNFLFYGQTTNDVINPVRSGVLQHTLSTGPVKQALFTAPSGSESEVTVSICNLGPDPATVKLGLANGGIDSFDSTEYLDFGFQIGPGQTYTRPNIKLGEGQSLVGFSNFGSKVTFLCHGQLFYAVSGSPTSDDFIVLGNSRIDGNLGIGRTADHVNSKRLDVLGATRITGQLDIVGNGINLDGQLNVGLGLSVTTPTFLNDNLTVDGSQTIINSGTVRIADHNLELGYLNTNDNASNSGGIVLKGATDKKITWNVSNSRWEFNQSLNFDDLDHAISINNVDVLTRDRVLGNYIAASISTSTPAAVSLPTVDAIQKENKKISEETKIAPFFLSQQWS